MKDKWNTLLIASIIAIIMMIFAIMKEYSAYGDYVFEELSSSPGVLVWLGSFLFYILFFYIAIDVIKRWNKKKK